MLGLQDVSRRRDSFHTWTEDEIVQFEARGPKGTRERTAFALYLP
jgi:hypothetical protein